MAAPPLPIRQYFAVPNVPMPGGVLGPPGPAQAPQVVLGIDFHVMFDNDSPFWGVSSPHIANAMGGAIRRVRYNIAEALCWQLFILDISVGDDIAVPTRFLSVQKLNAAASYLVHERASCAPGR